MNELELKGNSVFHTDSSRRKFMTKLLGGAAVAAPVIAALTVGASKATATTKTTYEGLNLFEATLFDPVTGVSGLATFELAVNEALVLSPITYTLTLSNAHAKANGGVLVSQKEFILSLPTGTPASIEPDCTDEGYTTFVSLLVDFFESSKTTITVSIPVTLHGVTGVLLGQLFAAPNAQYIRAVSILPCTIA